MFLIGIEKTKITELVEGTAVRINGFNTTLRREGDLLIYKDKDGVENRCQILMIDEDDIALNFACASHEQQGETLDIVTPDGLYEFENDTEEEKTQKYYWLAVNGPSVAASMVPLSMNLYVSPTPEQLIGFASYEEMQKTQQFLLTAPIEDVAEFMDTLPPRIRSGEIQYKRPRRPEPPSRGATMWSEADSLVT